MGVAGPSLPVSLLLFLFLFLPFIVGRSASSVVPLSPKASGQPRFGHALLSEFLLAEGYTNLNHGSFGSTPFRVLEAERHYSNRMERRPDRWFRHDLKPMYDDVRTMIASLVGAQREDLVLVPNASTGVNSVLRSLLPTLQPRDRILFFDEAYIMVKQTLTYLQDMTGAQKVMLNITYPTSNEALVSAVKQALQQPPEPGQGPFRIACFSHISSTPSLILPIKELTHVCHQHGVPVLVDAAHSLGQIPLDVTFGLHNDDQPEFVISNGHKWLFSPKGSAFLWVRRDAHKRVHPTVISYAYGQGMVKEFDWMGTNDYSAYLAMADAIKFRQWLGGDARIMSYIHRLAVWSGHRLAEMWNTETLVDDDMIGSMVNVRLPTTDRAWITELPTRLQQTYDTWVPVFEVQDKLYVRVSAQVFNEPSDYEKLGQWVLTILSSPSRATCEALPLSPASASIV